MLKKVIFGALTLMSLSAMADECLKTRAAFDIGSGTTKLKVATVDICNQKIIDILHEANRPVGYKQALKESSNNSLNEQIIEDGIKNILELKDEANKFAPTAYVAAATSAFRTASNGIQAAEIISIKTGIKINIISQEQEALIGFVGASQISDIDLKNIVVWDIGGGSMQMTSYNGNGNFDIFKGKVASVSFKNYIIENLHNQDISKVKSPNPISELDKKRLLIDLQAYAKINVPNAIVEKLKKPTTKVIGIGGVHYYSVGKVVSSNKTYDINMVTNKIYQYIDKTDEQLGGGEYVETNVSNLILVLGMMRALNIREVKTGKVNMADGLLIKPELVK